MKKELHVLGRVSEDVFERHTSTESGLFAFFGTDFGQIFEQIASIRVKILSNINLVVPRHIKREKASLPVEVHRSKMPFPKNFFLVKVSRSKFIEGFLENTENECYHVK